MKIGNLIVAAASMLTVASVAGGQMRESATETAPPKLLVFALSEIQ